ncbi:MAG: hypothetical protein LH614_06425 [Pyrinomonadaceae bacterium]|nr:hypothetical protein [Pyrinomonadaceae bacterium]
MRIPIEFDDETVVLIDEIAKISRLSRTEVVENILREAIVKDRKLIENQRLKEENLKSEN